MEYSIIRTRCGEGLQEKVEEKVELGYVKQRCKKCEADCHMSERSFSSVFAGLEELCQISLSRRVYASKQVPSFFSMQYLLLTVFRLRCSANEICLLI